MPALLFQPLASASQPGVILKSANEMCLPIGGFGDTEIKRLSRCLVALLIQSKETRPLISGSGGNELIGMYTTSGCMRFCKLVFAKS